MVCESVGEEGVEVGARGVTGVGCAGEEGAV